MSKGNFLSFRFAILVV